MAKNRLADESSPYLRQHQDNPVHWYPWGDEALDMAKAEGKPILLSIGYSACHWCHVMAHESFEDDATADLMNAHYINVKVDREERPDLDVIYQAALALMGQQGGWPLTMFLTPDGEPFWGGTYFAPDDRHGRPGFPEILKGISGTWKADHDKVLESADVLRTALETLNQTETKVENGGGRLIMDTVDRVAAATLGHMDPTLGGFRGAPKFAQVPTLWLLWRAWRRTRQRAYFEAVDTTLTRMAQGGIYDHLGGGFARYSTDEHWLVPHFEKMLYDNAQLISLMCEVYKQTGSPLMAARIAETVDWALREMKISNTNGDFAFASALDADTEGTEGRFYVWKEAEIDTHLGSAAPLFKQTYGVTQRGNWSEGGAGANVLNRTEIYPGEPAVETALEQARASLYKIRQTRPRPGRDTKVIAELNGMMIKALCEAASLFKRSDWADAANMAFAFVSQHMVKEGRLTRTWSDGKATQRAVLDDVAQMILAALALYETSGNEMYLAQGEAWAAQADDLFWCSGEGGYCLSARDVSDVITRSRTASDNATPSGNGSMATALARLFLLTGNDAYRARSQTVVDAFTSGAPNAASNMPTLLGAYELLAHGAQVVIAAHNGDDANLAHTALGAPGTLHVVIQGQHLVLPGHPAYGKTAHDGRAAAYVCKGGTCSPPVTSTTDLLKALEEL